MRFRHPIGSTEKSVGHTVAVSVIDDLKRFLGKGLTLSSVTDNEKNINFNIDTDEDEDLHNSYIDVTYKEKPSSLGTYAIEGLTTPAIILDKEINIRPTYVPSRIEFDISFTSKSKVETYNLAKSLKSLILDNKKVNSHNIEYRYYVPRYILKLLFVIFKYKEPVIGGDFKTYFESIMSNNISLAFSQDGVPKEIVALERQLNVTGMFSNLSVDESSIKFDKDKGIYKYVFNYSIEYIKAEYIDVSYQYVVHNKLLPKEVLALRNELTTTEARYLGEMYLERIVTQGSWLYKAMEEIPKRGYIQIPRFDVESNIEQVDGMLNVFSVLCLVGDDKTFLFNLNDLGDVQFTESVLSYLYDARNGLCSTNGAFFNIYLYEDDVISEIEIYVDEELNVRSVGELNIENMYRCMIRIVPNISRLNKEAKDLLLSYTKGNNAFFKYSLFTNDESWFRNRETIFASNMAFNFNIDLSYFENNKSAMYTVLTSYISAITKE
jgi:hypothetical protein